MFYNGHRYYDPRTGRYLQSDPLGFSSGRWSTYAYAGGNPLNGVDPLGLKDFDDAYGSSPQAGGPPKAGVGCMVGVGVVVGQHVCAACKQRMHRIFNVWRIDGSD